MDTRKAGFSLIGAGVLVLGSLMMGQFGGGSSVIDEHVISMVQEKYEVESGVQEDMVKPTVQVTRNEQAELSLEETKDLIMTDIDRLLLGQLEDDEDPTDYHQYLALVVANWDEFSAAEQEKLTPYILEPTNPDSFFHVSNWSTVGRAASAYLRLKNYIAPFAFASSLDDADKVDHFDDPSGYEYFESLVFDLNVYYPGVDLLPEAPLHAEVPSYPGASGAEKNYNYLMLKAFDSLTAAEEAYLEFKAFFGSALNQPARMYVVQSIVSGAQGLTLDCQRIYVPHTSTAPHVFRTETIAAHELFHCFQQDRGFAQVSGGLEAFVENVTSGNRRQWIVEGTAAFSQYMADMPEVDTHYFFERYVPEPTVSLFDKSYRAAVYWQSIYDHFGEGRARELMMAYQPSLGYSQAENEEHADMMSEDFHQIALNVADIQELYDDGTATQPEDDYPVDLGADYVMGDIEGSGSIYPFSLDLQEMSMQFFDFSIQGHGGYVRFDFGDEINQEDDDIEISAVLYHGSGHTYEKVELEEDDDGNKYVLFCLTSNDVCESAGREEHSGLYNIVLVVTNRSGTDSYSGDFLATLFGPDPYKGFFVVMNEGDLEVPVTGELDLTIDLEEGTMRMDAKDFWLKFSNDFYNWDSIEVPESPNVSDVEIHPTRLTKYVNNFCKFRGFIEFDFEPLSEDDDDEPWLTRKFKLKKTDQGNFYVMKHKFACEMDPAMFDVLGVNGPAVVVLQAMFAKINTTDYPDGSFAMNMHRLFKEFMTLGLFDDEEGEVEMKFMDDGGDYEVLKIEFNDQLHLYFEREG